MTTALLTACASAVVAGEVAPVLVPGTKVSIVPPQGFELADQFPGFQQVDMGSSIVVNEMPAPFGDLRAEFTSDGFASQGMTLVSSEPVRIGDLDGLLIGASQQAAGIQFRKWMVAFGAGGQTVLLVATFPEEFADELGESLKRTVLSAEWDPAAAVGLFDGLSFRIKETASLKIANRMTNMLMLTKDGVSGPVAPSDPMVVVGSSLGQAQVGDLEAFAKSRIMHTAEVTQIGQLKGAAVTIGGSPGYEITATAADADTGTALALYQVVVARRGAYYLVQGFVGAASADRYIPEFKEVANSLTFNDAAD